MRFDVDCLPGELARQPEQALSALAELAEHDGADREEWLAKAIKAVGAATAEVHVGEEPAYRVVSEAKAELSAVWRELHRHMLAEVSAVLRQAVAEADHANLRGAVEEG